MRDSANSLWGSSLLCLLIIMNCGGGLYRIHILTQIFIGVHW
ncbi:Hypothetical protein BN2458_PEG2093 [Helicobacter typhlonius]|uniref:Uncharacterized protein n=1 Tax=Helicobacter typhlonius TaxID=76936 RepID=A0A0S4Q028_9HELI|nr:Hypothetical protein BN2458_PEG2093 [Helicobacter typhlonius]